MPEFKPSRPDSRLAGLLADYPASLFNDRLYQSIELADRYCLDLAIALVQRLGVVPQLGDWRSVAALCQRLDFQPRFRAALAWLLARLAAGGLVSTQVRDGTRRYRLAGPLPVPALDALAAAGLAIDPANAATLNLLDAAAAAYPAVAKDQSSGEEALLGAGNIGLWLAYFHNSNPLYAVNNWVSAIAAANRLAAKPRLRILEIGAGGGSGTEALLDILAARELAGRVEHYVVTEPSPFLRRRNEREIKARYRDMPLSFRALDIDQPWRSQGVAEAGFDLVYGVNVLHVANDLAFSLGEARRALAADGWLVAGECLRPFPGHPIYIELVFRILDGFIDVTIDPETRPNPGFLTCEHWQRAFLTAGFKHFQVAPDHERIREIYPRLYIGAICGC